MRLQETQQIQSQPQPFHCIPVTQTTGPHGLRLNFYYCPSKGDDRWHLSLTIKPWHMQADSVASADCTKLHSVVTKSSTPPGTSKRISWTSFIKSFSLYTCSSSLSASTSPHREQTSSKSNIHPNGIFKILESLKNLPKISSFWENPGLHPRFQLFSSEHAEL